MSLRKPATINISKGLMNVSFATLATVGSATGNPLIAGATVLPQALASSGILRQLLEKRQEEHLELAIPPWWTGEPQSQSWQEVCSSIEYRLPDIVKGVQERLSEETSYPSSSDVKQIFIEQVFQYLSPWEVKSQDRGLVAGYVTPLLLEKSAEALKAAIESTREDALANWLTQISNTLDTIQSSIPTNTALSMTTATQIAPAAGINAGANQSLQSIAAILEQKRQNDDYDVYVCYDEADVSEVMDIGNKLKSQGILPWLDVLEVKPGTVEKREQERQIQRIPAAAIFVGQHNIVDKQELQMYSFIDEFFEREIPVIPVILAGAPKDFKLPPYLGNFWKVDFRGSVSEPMGQLIFGITGKRPAI